MSKPLCFILQLNGLGFFCLGLGNAAGGGLAGIIIGLVLIIIGGIGFRKRIKDNTKPVKTQENNWTK